MTIEEYSALMGYEKACGMEEYGVVEALGNIAAKMIGRADCIRWKLEQGFALGDADKAYIMDNLKP